MGTFLDSTHMKLVPFEVISSGCNALVVPFQQFLEGPVEVLLCERVNDFRHSLFHLLNCLIATASELQDGRKAVWSIPYASEAFFPSLKHNFSAYRSSKVSSRPDCIFEIHQLWQSGFSRVYSNSYRSCSFEPKIIKIGQSSHKMYSNNILNFQESTTILNTCTKRILETYTYIHRVQLVFEDTYILD